MKTSVVIVAAGLGSRMNAGVNKQFLELAGRPVLYHTIEAFQQSGVIDEIILVLKDDEIDYVRENILSIKAFNKVTKMVAGGKERSDSVKNGLDAVAHDGVVLIHDGARPMVTKEEIKGVVAAVLENGAALVGTKVKDTIKSVYDNGLVESTHDRSRLWAVSTPQGFDVTLVKKAFRDLKDYDGPVWDDAMVVELMGKPVKMVEGSYENIKITTPIDILIGESILKKRQEEKDG